ncbi:HAUS augmin-like complex subunit 3 [Halichondria panicea]|uniref:HAUS augmin-like complex subunit 3 n=1 Tax=Halichondria panicea TaxID=6063 RepID=UPI00312B74A0
MDSSKFTDFSQELKMTVDVAQLQSSFQASLLELGYTGNVGQLPSNLGQNEKLFGFVKAVTERLNRKHHLTSTETAEYEKLKESGATLKGEALQEAVSRLSGSGGQRSSEAVSKEVEELKLQVASAKSHLSTLTAVKGKLSEHYASLAHERDDLEAQKTTCQRQLQASMEKADQDNAELNNAAQELDSSVQSVCQFHGEDSKPPPGRFLSQVSQDDYFASERKYLTELTAYSKKQFFEGIVNMVSGDSEGGDLDLGDREGLLLRGFSQEQYHAHCQELARLQAVYPVTEMKYLNAKMAEQYSVSAAAIATENLSTLRQPGSQLEPAALREQISVKQTQRSGLECQIQEMCLTVLPALLKDMATLKVTTVLHGDHDLKLARQEYFNSKQTKVIESLQSQRARHELLSMLYEVELRRHRETHRLLSATKKQLDKWKSSRDQRLLRIKSATLVDSSAPRQTVDSGDTFTQTACALLGLSSTPEAPFITIDSLKAAFKQLAQRLTTAEDVLQAMFMEQEDLMEEQHQHHDSLVYSVFHNSEKPVLTIEEYQAEYIRLKSVVTTMEKNIKALLKQFDSHRKTISSDSSLTTERKLFVHFFIDSNKLHDVIGEITKRIDTITATIEQ